MNYFSKYYLDYHNLDQDMINKEFIHACTRGNTEQMEYLCFSSELTTNAQYDKSSVLLSALRVSILLEKEDALVYIINKLNVQKTIEIENLLVEFNNPLANSLFLNRDLRSSTKNKIFRKI